MEEVTLEQIINGFRCMPGSMEERAAALASYLSSRFGPKTLVAVDRIEGTVAHFMQQAMLENPLFRQSGCMGNPYRFETSRFEIDMVPQTAG